MKTIETKCLLDNDKIENIEIAGFEQSYTLQIGEDGYIYEADIIRDDDGTIDECREYGALSDVTCDAETYIAHLINTDPDEWYYVDQKLFDADTDETFTHYVNVKEFISNHELENDAAQDFITKNIDEDGYLPVYFTVTDNTILAGDE